MRAIRTAAVCIALFTPAAGAATFEYVSRGSRIEIGGELPGVPPPNDLYDAAMSTSSFAPFDHWLDDEILWNGLAAGSDAGQTSILGPTELSAVGQTYMQLLSPDGTGSASASAASTFEVVFDLSQPVPVELAGWVHTPPGSGPPSDLACQVRLERWDGSGWDLLYGEMYEQPLAFADTLPAGRYGVRAEAFIAGDSGFGEFPYSGSTRFDFVMRIVPEPSTLAPLLLLSPIMARRFARRRPPRPA